MICPVKNSAFTRGSPTYNASADKKGKGKKSEIEDKLIQKSDLNIITQHVKPELNQEEGANSSLAKNLGTPVQTMRSNLSRSRTIV